MFTPKGSEFVSAQKRIGLLGIVLALAAAVAAIVIWVLPNHGSTSKNPVSSTPTAAPSPSKPSKDQLYFNGISHAVKDGDLHAQSLYVAEQVRAAFVQNSVLMFPKGTKVVFQTDTLVADTPTTGHITAIVNGKQYLVLLVKEQDTSSNATVWHISDTEEVKG